jgi:hypothetical protein
MAKIKQTLADPKVLPSVRPLILLLLAVLIGLSLVAAQCATVEPVVTSGPAVTPAQVVTQEKVVIPDTTTPPALTAIPEFYVLEFVDGTFVTEGVTGTIPMEMNPDGKLQVHALTQPPPPCDPSNKCIRVVLDFRVFDTEKQELVTTFYPSMTLTVKYTEDDVSRVLDKNWQNLRLRFWNGEQWQAFPGLALQGDAAGGFGHVSITAWGDRPVVWGDPD